MLCLADAGSADITTDQHKTSPRIGQRVLTNHSLASHTLSGKDLNIWAPKYLTTSSGQIPNKECKVVLCLVQDTPFCVIGEYTSDASNVSVWIHWRGDTWIPFTTTKRMFVYKEKVSTQRCKGRIPYYSNSFIVCIYLKAISDCPSVQRLGFSKTIFVFVIQLGIIKSRESSLFPHYTL